MSANEKTHDEREEELFSEKEIRFIEGIRAEASEVKDCYTKFSFQSWVFASIFLAAIAKLQTETPEIGLFSLLPLVLLLSVGRIGIHKYTTANRLYGFELYMNRRRRLERSMKISRHRTIGWEEAYYAWRIVQTSLYKVHYPQPVGPSINSLTVPNLITHEGYTEEKKSIFERTKWNDDVMLYPGAYLSVTFSIMIVFCLACLFTMCLSSVSALVNLPDSGVPSYYWNGYPANKIQASFIFLVVILTSGLLYLRLRKLRWRRNNLESGFNSINSCAVIWNVTIHAHFRAIDKLRESEIPFNSFNGYSEALSEVTSELVGEYKAGGIQAMYTWMGDDHTGVTFNQ